MWYECVWRWFGVFQWTSVGELSSKYVSVNCLVSELSRFPWPLLWGLWPQVCNTVGWKPRCLFFERRCKIFRAWQSTSLKMADKNINALSRPSFLWKLILVTESNLAILNKRRNAFSFHVNFFWRISCVVLPVVIYYHFQMETCNSNSYWFLFFFLYDLHFFCVLGVIDPE